MPQCHKEAFTSTPKYTGCLENELFPIRASHNSARLRLPKRVEERQAGLSVQDDQRVSFMLQKVYCVAQPTIQTVKP